MLLLPHYPGSRISFQDFLSTEILSSKILECDIKYEPKEEGKLMNRVGVEDLSEEQRVNAARVIVKSCMNVKRGEKVLLIVQNDERRKLVGRYLEAEVRRLKAIPTVIFVEDNEMKAEPPESVVDAMMTSDVILATLNLDNTQIIAHTKARNVATNEKRARFGMAPILLPNITHDDIMKIRERTERVARIMEGGKIARITGPDETNLTFSVEGRKCERLRASMWEPGEWGAVPLYAEAALAPVEGTANGKYVVNGFFEYVGRVAKPFAWIIKNGRIVEVVGDGPEAEKCRKILAAADENGTNIAELGVATNHILTYEGFSGTVTDKMILGTLHIACGKNTTFVGGHVYSDIHHDAVSGGMTLEIDGTRMIENGKWLLDS
jgi:leucyl aminopeptidase (aminopeptidase T)